jgi:ribosome biogenesis GTPase
VALPDGERLACVLKGRSLRIAVGDRVTIERDRDGGVITGIEPRRNLVYRSDAFKEKLVAANVTQVAASWRRTSRSTRSSSIAG